MVGRGAHRVLAVSSSDPVLDLVGPLGLAASAVTALVIDLAERPRLRTGRTLREVAEDGPRLDDLAPGRTGVAVLSSGGIAGLELEELINRLAQRWPATVVMPGGSTWPGPIVPLRALYPGCLAPEAGVAAVWQSLAGSRRPPGPGPLLPRLPSRLVRLLCSGRVPLRSRWVGAWEMVWDLPWA